MPDLLDLLIFSPFKACLPKAALVALVLCKRFKPFLEDENFFGCYKLARMDTLTDTNCKQVKEL